ncbi:MAG: Minf_1886 family protein [Candidatus Omnitrophota bacterium]
MSASKAKNIEFTDRVRCIVERDGRFGPDSYLFVMQALDGVMRELPQARHISAQELLNGISLEARRQFGPMSQTVFGFWGIHESLDFGHVVFNMVGEGILSRRETDALEDFKSDLFFERLFDASEAYQLKGESEVRAAASSTPSDSSKADH